MRLLLTAVAEGSAPLDLLVDCDEDATVADLSRSLAAYTALGVRPARQEITAGARLHVVGGLTRPADQPAGPPPDLWWRGRILDPSEPLALGALRHGAVVGVGHPLADVLAEPFGVVEVRVVGGPGAGRVQRLSPGTYPIGTAASSPLPLHDLSLPPTAFELEINGFGQATIRPDPSLVGVSLPAPYRARPLDGPIVIRHDAVPDPPRRRRFRRKKKDSLLDFVNAHDSIDPQADVPVLHLERRPVAGETRWEPGRLLAVGLCLLELEAVTQPDASMSPTPAGATLDYNRPPRLLPAPRASDFTVPPIPRKPDKQSIPWAMVIAPVVMSGGMYAYTHSPLTLMFAGLTPIMALSNSSTSRRTAKRNYRQQVEDFRTRKTRVERDAYESLVSEREVRRHDFADPAALLVTATGPRVRLWERRPTDPDWLFARVGTADVPSDVTVREPAREAHEGPLLWTAPDVPVTVPLAEVGVTGIAGPDELRRAIGRWIVAQTAVLHSPAEIELVVFADQQSAPDWAWVRWLPHARPADAAERLVRAATDDESAGGLIRELLNTLQGRQAIAKRDSRFEPILVVLDGARRLRLLPGVVSLLQDGPSVGIYFLCLDADHRQLPEECRAVVSPLGADGNLRVSITGRPDVDAVRADLVDLAWCERVARALAPIRDVSSEDLAGALPGSSRLLTVLGLEHPTGTAIAEGWRHGGRTTRAIVGEGLDGPIELDLRRDGPHGLVAGTTGSGKSELLQTIIASLAVGNRPDEMTFVLIDYKGGAAFKDCDHLPHTVGMVTDLDGHLTTRALESLAAELRRREHQLAGADAKDIEDYTAGRTATSQAMPRLLIVIDEFAAMVAELPDFVTGLVDIARRGRSLGVHLILATQRPAGVVSAEIKSNTNLRIALRVTDANDSQDVIESSDAATISKSTPGRAFARLGHSSLTPFQSARVGGRPRAAGAGAAVRISDLRWSTALPGRAVAEAEDDVSIPTDLATLVASITEACALVGVAAPPSPWLPPLPEVITLADVSQLVARSATADAGIEPLAFGLVDIPSEQSRAAATYDLTGSSHFCIIGAARTGRSTALRAMGAAIGAHVSPRDVHIYGVDCGNNALLPLVSLPHTGAVVTRDQPDRLSRLTARLLQTISSRQQALAEGGFADLREQRANSAPEDRLPYLVTLFDRWEGFVAAFDNYDAGRLIDNWMQILQEGASVGIKVIATSDRTALVGRLSTLIDDKLVLRLTDPSDFGNIGLPGKQVPDHLPEGRGFRADGLRETQVALLTPDPSGAAQVAALHEIGRQAALDSGRLSITERPFRVDPLPMRITWSDAGDLLEQPLRPGELPVGVGGDTLVVNTIDALEHGPGFLVAGPRRTGRSTTLQLLATAALDRSWDVVTIAPRQSPLRELADVFTLETDRETVTTAITALATSERSLLVIDDLELLGTDGWLIDLIVEHHAKIRDHVALIAAAGILDELTGVYRGLPPMLKKSRSGLLLSPQSPGDGDLFGVRLPRSAAGGSSVPGRGILFRGGALEPVQAILPN